jgi:hypothetical protein
MRRICVGKIDGPKDSPKIIGIIVGHSGTTNSKKIRENKNPYKHSLLNEVISKL